MRGKEPELAVYQPVASVEGLSLGATSHAWRSLRERLAGSDELAVTSVDAAVLTDCLQKQRQVELRHAAVGFGAGLLASLCVRTRGVAGALLVGSCTASGVAAGVIMGSKKTLARMAMLQTPLGASVRGELFVRMAPDECARSDRLHEEVRALLARQRASRWGGCVPELAADGGVMGAEEEGGEEEMVDERPALASLIRSSGVWVNRVLG